MARKKNVDDEELDIDIEDIDLDFDLDDEDLDLDRKPTKGDIAKRIGKDTSKGFLSGLTASLAKRSLPSEYEYYYKDALEHGEFVRDIVSETAEEVNKTVHGFSKEIKKLLPFQSKLLNKYIESQDYRFEKSKGTTEEEMREASMQSNLNEIFEKQAELNTKFSQVTSDIKRSQEQIEASRIQTNVLSNIDKSTAGLSAFHLNIGKAYYKKSLELQFKTYFIQADMLKLQREHFAAFATQFDRVIHNTSLPDMAKITKEDLENRKKEESRRTIENRAMFSNSEYISDVRDRISKIIRSKRSEILGQLSEGSGMLGMMSDTGDGRMMLLQAILDMAGGVAGDRVSDWLAPKIRERIEGNERIEAGGQMLRMISTNPRTLFKTLRESVNREVDESDPFSLRGRLMSLLQSGLSVTETKAPDLEVYNRSNILTHNQPAIFDNKVHRSISEVIPMYLSRILQANTNMYRAYSQVNHKGLEGFTPTGELMYDYNKRSLSTVDKIKEGLSKSLFKVDTKRDIGTLASSMLGRSSSELARSDKKEERRTAKGMNTDENRELLTSYIAKARERGLGTDFSSIVEGYGSSEELKALAKETGVNTLLDNITKATNRNRLMRESFDRGMTDIGQRYPLSSVKRFFTEMSILVGEKFRPDITNESAKAFAEVMTDYILEKGDAITPNLIMRDLYIVDVKLKDGIGRVTNISKAQHELIKYPMSQLKEYIKRVYNKDEQLVTLKMNNIFGDLDNALRQRLTGNKESHQILSDYDPRLRDKGRLRRQNIVEGSLDTVDSSDNLTRQQVMSGIKQYDLQAPLLHSQTLDKIIGVGEGGEERLKRLGGELKGASISDKLRILRRESTKMMDDGKKLLNEQYKKYEPEFKKMKDLANEIPNMTASKIKEALVKQLRDRTRDLRKYRQEFITLQDTQIRSLETQLQAIQDQINDQSVIKDHQKKLDKAKKLKEEGLKVLDYTLSELDTMTRGLNDLTGEQTKDSIKKVYELISGRLENLLSQIPTGK